MIYSDVMTYETILAQLLQNVPDDVDKREGSVIYDALAPAADAIAGLYRELDVVMDETFVDTASMQYIQKRCEEKGLAVSPATAATVQGSFTPSSVSIAVGTAFACGDMVYAVSEQVSSGVYKLLCQTAGTEGNLSSGALIPVTNVPGLATAAITALLIPGEDADNADTLREKYFDSIGAEAFGGNVADYVNRTNAIDGVGGVKVLPAWNGGGTVKLIIINSQFQVASSALVSAVQTAADPTQNQGAGLGFAPIGHTVTVVSVGQTTVNIGMHLTYNTGWSWATAESYVLSCLADYISELCADWDSTTNLVVRVSQIESRVLNLEPILDIETITLNGTAGNLLLATDKIPLLGTVTPT